MSVVYLKRLARCCWIEPNQHLPAPYDNPHISVTEGFGDLDAFQDVFGGEFGRNDRGKYAGLRTWYIQGEPGMKVLTDLRPFLFGRRKENADTWFS